ncbi:MAG: DUF3795 domain-containing protein [Anaerolineae bacterium]|jgi:hypothetical protein
MEIRPEHVAPCGLYCGVCRIYQATRADDRKFLGRITKIYARHLPDLGHVTLDDILCDGCLSERRSITCRVCAIRECVGQKGFPGCHECHDFPCAFIDEFPMPVGKKVILRAIPYWRAHGTEQWILAEEERYRCPECGQKLFRGVKRCQYCKSPVDLD